MPNASLRLLTISAVILSGCGGPKPVSTSAAVTPNPTPVNHPLGGIVGQSIVITPVQALRVPPEIGWPVVASPRPMLARLDSVLADTLRERVGNREWVFTDALLKSAANNPTYATDPRGLAVNPLRSAVLKVEDRLTEPLASQLRTMIALQDARLVLIPVDITVERVGAGIGRPVVRLVLVDPRSSTVRWIGHVAGPDAPAFTPDIFATIATRFADLFVDR
jgi:hypothetical protein